MISIVILNVLFIWVHPAVSEPYTTFASKEVRLLNDGNVIPLPGFGTAFPIDQLDELPQAVYCAIENRYRTIDSDVNEDLLAQPINNATSCGLVTREKLFIIAKLPMNVYKRKRVVVELQLTLKRLQLQYIDLYLLNTPNPLSKKNIDILEIWNGMEDAKKLGLTKSIGVVNFKREQLNLILPYCTTKPAVNQLEVNPTFTNIDLVEYCINQGIIVMAYAPFGFTVPRPGVTNRPSPSLYDPVFVKIAKKYGVTTSQIVLRYLIDRGTIPIPSSSNSEHIRLNRDILDFCLTDEEVETINKYNINRPVYPISTWFTDYNTKMVQANRRNKKLYPL